MHIEKANTMADNPAGKVALLALTPTYTAKQAEKMEDQHAEMTA